MNVWSEKDILYEDGEILVTRKPSKVAVQHAAFGKMDLEHLLLNYLAGRGQRKIQYLGVIHRLDQPVEGVLVFAKTSTSAKMLNADIQTGRMIKEYRAVVDVGDNAQIERGTLIHYLLKDGRTNTSRVVDKNIQGAKRAELTYELEWLDEKQKRAKVRICLKTGRHHQIRVQMAAAGMPLCGDKKYNPNCRDEENLALCAFRLTFYHPLNKKRMCFETEPENPLFRINSAL